MGAAVFVSKPDGGNDLPSDAFIILSPYFIGSCAYTIVVNPEKNHTDNMIKRINFLLCNILKFIINSKKLIYESTAASYFCKLFDFATLN
ncbi:hypothetical protein GMMP15_1130007 [Candidatus Magnetomoraceae bacterium gMMP-15]